MDRDRDPVLGRTLQILDPDVTSSRVMIPAPFVGIWPSRGNGIVAQFLQGIRLHQIRG